MSEMYHRRALLIAGGVTAMVWPFSAAGAPADPATVLTSGIAVVDKREDRPAFKRSYTKTLDSRATVTVEARTSYSRHFSGELRQPNGNRVYFDPERIAETIIDPLLVPLVTTFCNEVFALDRAYVKSKPSEFTDEDGVRWQRAKIA